MDDKARCQQCNQEFQSQDELSRHNQERHQGQGAQGGQGGQQQQNPSQGGQQNR